MKEKLFLNDISQSEVEVTENSIVKKELGDLFIDDKMYIYRGFDNNEADDDYDRIVNQIKVLKNKVNIIIKLVDDDMTYFIKKDKITGAGFARHEESYTLMIVTAGSADLFLSTKDKSKAEDWLNKLNFIMDEGVDNYGL